MASSDPAQYATSANLTRRADLHRAYARTGWFAWLADRIQLAPGATVLDVGCGPGWFWRNTRMAEGVDLTLLDISPGMVEEAVAGLSRVASVTGVVGDAADLPIEAARFDAVFLMHMLYHVPDPLAALAEAHRVLRPGGHVFITLNSADDLQAITDLIIEVFGDEPMDFAATRLFLDDAEGMAARHFTGITRRDLTESYACTNPDVVLDFIYSMPPAKGTARERMAGTVAAAFERAGGTLHARRHTGLITGTKPAEGAAA